MNEERIKQRLQESEPAEFPLQHIETDAIRSRARRHRHIRNSGVALALLAVIPAWVLLRSPAGPQPHPTPIVREDAPPAYAASAQALAAHIESEARARLDRRRAASALAAGETISIEDAREAAARTMVMTAPGRGELAGMQAAAAVYRRTIELFPEAPSAATARQALAQLNSEN